MKIHPGIYFSLLFLSLVINVNAQTKRAQIDQLLKHSSQLGILNGNVLVIDQGRPVYQGSFGYADATKKTKLNEKYRFHIGSIAKEFNAVGIMMLQEQGKLKLDSKLSSFFADLPVWADSISVKDLLQYTSGLPDLKWNAINKDEEAMTAMKKIVKLDFQPGTNYAYNNSNTFFQRRIIEKIKGIPFNRFVKDSMLKKAGMLFSIVDPGEQDLMMARSFNKDGVQDPMTYPQSGWTAVTIDDFFKWSQALNAFKLINASSTHTILTPFATGKQSGLGNGEIRNNKIAIHVHDGSARNYQALLDVDNTKGRTIIWVTNSRNPQMFAVTEAIKHILDGVPYTLPKKSVFDLMQKPADSLTGVAILRYYEGLRSKLSADHAFDSETELNMLGYHLLGKKRIDDAILVFEYNSKLFPYSGNVFDSLAEAYYAKSDWQNAFIHYSTSLYLDSTNKGAREKIVELRTRMNTNRR